MGSHTFDVSRADRLEESGRRYRFLSAEELLWALSPSPEDVVADFGSGTGFFTDDVAPHVGEVHAIDVQEGMHDYYREKGVPENVSLVTSDVGDLPLADGAVDAAFSTMTYHEFADDAALAEIRRVLAPDGRLVVADWAATGTGEYGPPVDERYGPDEAATALGDAGFDIEHEATRLETFLLIAAVE